MGKQDNAWNILLGNSEKKRRLRIHRWEGNMKMDLKEHNGTATNALILCTI
jgi:hypothetical protein